MASVTSLLLLMVLLVASVGLASARRRIMTIDEADELREASEIARKAANRVKRARPKISHALRMTKQMVDFAERRMQLRALKAGFLATAAKTRAYDQHEIFQFEDVSLNIGNRYDSKTGVFHCDDQGLWVFMVTIQGGSKPTWYELMDSRPIRKKMPLITRFVGYTGSSSQSSSTSFTVIRCSPDKEVYIRRSKIQDAYKHQVWHTHSVFTGFKMM